MEVDTLIPAIMMNVAAPKGLPRGDLNGVFMKGLVQNNSNAQLELHPRRFSSPKM